MSGNRNKSIEWISPKMRPACCLAAAVMIFAFLTATAGIGAATSLTVFGVDKAGTETPLAQYRWVLEEDVTYRIDPGVPTPDILAVGFHKSYMPVVAQGDDVSPLSDIALDPDKYYYVSVIPKEPGSYSIGGAGFKGSDGTVAVFLNALPLPTAQITVFVHEDLNPINNVWDEGEAGLEGFRIILEDAGGRYGISAGEQSQDAFGNPLGTTYLRTCDTDGANPGTGTFFCLDPDGNPIVDSFKPLLTGPDGSLIIKNLAPGKYGIIVVPPNAVESPPGSGNYVSSDWVQTSTIEGTVLIDAWVEANEPPFFAEFGPAGPHTSFGFVPAGPNKPYIDATALTGGAAISGQIVNLHLPRPPQTTFHKGAPFPHTTPWVGLNQGAAGVGRGVYAARASEDGTFAIPDVPPGNYQLVVWDDNLDLIFAFHDLTVGGANIDLGEVPVFQWFTRLENWVFFDRNENGFREADEPGIAEQAVNLRWRDGSVYQSMPTDGEGFVPFDEVFPFFAWLVAEVDFARFKATGVTVTVDDGGAIDPADPWSWEGQLNPQNQRVPTLTPMLATTKYRTERGPVLTQAFQGFLGQTSVIEWGKKEYGPGENGGISGMVFYSVTRAEDDPELGTPEPWEPGIPRVTVNLYDAAGTTLLNTTTTDSWDDSLPEGCPPGSNAGSPLDDPFVFRGKALDCYDGMRNWNQVRPGVFDGGYAFDAIIDPGTGLEVSPIPPGQYVVEVVPPPGYEIVRSQDKNVDFGDEYTPSLLLLPPKCVGEVYTVPAELTLFPGVEAPLAGEELNSCDRKQVALSDGANAAADFFLFTQVPIAGHIKGFILDDIANEFDPASPQFGEKFAPPWLPVSVRDWTGRIIASTYSDEFGTYNVLVPSTYTNSLPQPSGMSPNMLTACMNDPEADTAGEFFNPQYSTFCYTFQYMPGTTTYLDTPVVPVAAFAGPDQYPLDCALPDHTPRIFSVTTSEADGPYLSGDNDAQITITSVGTAVEVPNPAYDGLEGTALKTVPRDFGFGPDTDPGTVFIGEVQLTDVSWGDTVITATVPAGTPTGQLVVTRGDNGRSSVTAVTVQAGTRPGGNVVPVSPGPGAIQAAIEAAGNNDLILVAPGTYDEMVIMWKPVQLQGSGEGTVINAVKSPPSKLIAWRQLLESHLTAGNFDMVPGQQDGFVPGIMAEPFSSEEGAGVLVVANAPDSADTSRHFDAADNRGARIDGFTIRGADTGGGIVVNGYADYLEISNNRIFNNNGFYNGGIRVGHPFLTYEIEEVGTFRTDSDNDFVRISRNQITLNGGFDGAGGGVSLYNGSDGYEVAGNFVCGNFTLGHGGGIGHLGLSDSGEIVDNIVLFNENFNQQFTVNGGGISIAGQAPFGCPVNPETGAPDPACLADPVRALSPGAGSVSVERNRIQGNSAGAGDGAGIRLTRINGQDVAASPEDDEAWYAIDVINNMIVNNVAGLAGGGISIQDALRVNILHNTIARNDSTATAGEAFTPGSPSVSNPQPGAGIVSRGHTPDLSSFLPDGEEVFSNPELVNNVIWQNRQFYFRINDTDPTDVRFGLCPDIDNIGLGCDTNPVFSDLAVLPAGSGALNPVNSLLTDPAGYDASNISGDPLFYAEYFNGNRESTITIPETTTSITPTVAFDEGGNYIRLRYGPLTETRLDTGGPYGDYHIYANSPAVDAGNDLGITDDFDGLLTRPFNVVPDIGADEIDATTPDAPAAAPQAALLTWTPDKQGNPVNLADMGSINSSLAPQAGGLEAVLPVSAGNSGGSGSTALSSDEQTSSAAGSRTGRSGGGTQVIVEERPAQAGEDRGERPAAAYPANTGRTAEDAYPPSGADVLPGTAMLPEDQGSFEPQAELSGQDESGSDLVAEGTEVPVEENVLGTAAASQDQETGIAPAGEQISQAEQREGQAGSERPALANVLPFASLIVLVLGGLLFFAVLQPRARKKTAQQRREDI
jgi:large repetitive protein